MTVKTDQNEAKIESQEKVEETGELEDDNEVDKSVDSQLVDTTNDVLTHVDSDLENISSDAGAEWSSEEEGEL